MLWLKRKASYFVFVFVYEKETDPKRKMADIFRRPNLPKNEQEQDSSESLKY